MDNQLPMLRSSERAAFKRCPQRWWWGAVEGLMPVNFDTGARWFGTGIHLCMAEYYIPGRKRGRPLTETWREYTKDTYNTVRVQPDWTDESKAQFLDARKLGREMLEFYEETYRGDPHWEVIAPENRFAVRIPHPNNAKEAIVTYVGTWDLVIRDLNDGHVKLVDTKTSNKMPSSYDLANLELDDQAGPYISLATTFLRSHGIIGPRESVRGMEYNYLVKRVKDDRPQDEFGRYLNKDGSVSKIQPPDPVLRHYVARTVAARKRQIKRIQDDALWMEKARSGELPIIKNPTRECNWCDFFDLCQIDENGGDFELMKKMTYKKGDIYADHREGAVNSKTSVQNKTETGVR